jgi:hypothetical protein
MGRALLPKALVAVLGLLVAGAAVLGVVEVPAAAPPGASHRTAYRPPAGWQTVTFGGAAISVPARWVVAYLQACPSNHVGTLVVGTPTPRAPVMYCPLVVPNPPPQVVHLGHLAGPPPPPRGAPSLVVNGLRLYAVVASVGGWSGRVWTIPSLHLEISTRGPGTAAVVRTLRRA